MPGKCGACDNQEYFHIPNSVLAGEGQGHAGVGGQGASGGVEVDVVPGLVAADGGRGVGGGGREGHLGN